MFRSSWLFTAFFSMMALIFLSGAVLPWLGPAELRGGGYSSAAPMSVMFSGASFLMLYLGGPRELRLNLNEKTYCHTRWWVPSVRAKTSAGPSMHFSGVCITSNDTLLLVFLRRRGFLYGLFLGQFGTRAGAVAAAAEFTVATGLPIVRVPWVSR